MEGMIAEFQEKKDKLESHKREIEGKKIKLEDDKKKDGIALKNT